MSSVEDIELRDAVVLHPGDGLIIEIPEPINAESAQRLKEMLRERLGDVPIVILAGGARVGAVIPSEEPQR